MEPMIQHPWNLDVREAFLLQKELASRVIHSPGLDSEALPVIVYRKPRGWRINESAERLRNPNHSFLWNL
ncbi:hypothetical protein JOD24_003104 [Kroppenstedtia sanguinis]|uniref:hypothetical protein n=1 Tax=Kroppenstedtia sanguinis TaxID=1380684 RepID=UPI003D19796A